MVHRILLIGCILLAIAACRRRDKCNVAAITVVNRTERAVYCRFAQVSDSFDWKEMSKLFGENPRNVGRQQHGDSTYFALPSYTEKRELIYEPYRCIGDYFDPGDPLKGMFIFFIDSAAVDTMSWDTVKTHNIYSKLYKLNYQDMEKIGWTVQYSLP
ncbi:hypothetical protein GCM10023093_26940 [Nemorincola caseinilytica]|uniref:Uncharacterized protein n=1 Tax=Nemorincola caseinilytica TaxID=2054315 RepID=A0ABP8NP99_9BACT